MENKSKIERPLLGQRCSFAATVQRVHDGQIRRWESISYPPSEGIYVGYRKLVNGVKVEGYRSYDDSTPGYLKDIALVEVWLFVINPRKDPLRVMPQDVEWEKISE